MWTIIVRVLSSGPSGLVGMIHDWSKRRIAKMLVIVITKATRCGSRAT